MAQPPLSQLEEFWLFGYGSLIWKPPPHYDLRVPGYITGYVRRFWQASEDHRGTPEAPGRVVTLIEQACYESLVDKHSLPALPVWGAAYRIPPEHVQEVSAYLDLREINGYSIQYTSFYPAQPFESLGRDSIRCLVYIGLPTNPQFLGAQRPEDVAAVVHRSRGPSGENVEYLLMLERALNGLGEGSMDEHVNDLAKRITVLEAETGSERVIGDGRANERS